MFNNFFFSYEEATGDIIIGAKTIRFACRIAKARTDTHTHTRIAFPQRRWLGEGVSLLRYKYIGCLF